jgi:hypothetical protein
MALLFLDSELICKIFARSARVLIGRKVSKLLRASLDLEQIGDILVRYHEDGIPSLYFLLRTVGSTTSVFSQGFHGWGYSCTWLQSVVERIRQSGLDIGCLGLSVDRRYDVLKLQQILDTMSTDHIRLLQIKIGGHCDELTNKLRTCALISETLRVELIIESDFVLRGIEICPKEFNVFFQTVVLTAAACPIVRLDLRCHIFLSTPHVPPTSGRTARPSISPSLLPSPANARSIS